MAVQLSPIKDAAVAEWLMYWCRAGRVNFSAIRSLDHVYQARKYCSCMRVGVFTEASDLQIWLQIQALRAAGKLDEET